MRRYLTFLGAGLALFLGSMNATAVTVAFPVLIQEMDTSLVLGGWVFTVYQITSMIVMPLAGKASEVLGRTRAFHLFLLVFIVGSALGAVAPNIGLMIVFRVIQAAGNAGFMPCASDIVSNLFPNSRQRAIGLFSSILPVGEILGPNLGAWLVGSFGWRSVFYFSTVGGAIVLAVAWLLLRGHGSPTAQRAARPGIDFAGVGLIAGFVLPLMVGLSQVSNATSVPTWLVVTALLGLSGVMLYLFIRREGRIASPIIDFHLLRARPFLAANIYNFIYGLCAFGVFALVPLYAISVYGVPVEETGVLITPRFIGMLVFSTATTFTMMRFGYRRPILLGTSLLAVGLLFVALELPGIGPGGAYLPTTSLLMIIMFVCGSGAGVAAPASNNACIDLAPDKVAAIAGLRGMFRTVGSALSITITTLIIQKVGDVPLGFTIAFGIWAAAVLTSIPFILAMPSRPIPSAPGK